MVLALSLLPRYSVKTLEVGATAGAVSGGAAGYSAYAKRGEIQVRDLGGRWKGKPPLERCTYNQKR